MKTPIDAVVTQWAQVDGVGRLKLSTGEEVRFGASACPVPPKVGLAVQVLALSPHPLGGQRATSMQLPPGTSADEVFDQSSPAPGLLDVRTFVELTDDVGLFGVVLREPLTTRAQLRAWFERAGGVVDFSDPRVTLVRFDRVTYRAWRCMGELAGGKGIITFSFHTPMSLQTERQMALARGERIDVFTAHQALVRAVAKLAASELFVIVHQARGTRVPAEEWIAREPLEAWTWHTKTTDGQTVMCGFRALLLPDLFSKTDTGDPLNIAGRALVDLGRRPQEGERLGPFTVLSTDDQWVRLGYR